MAEEPEITLVCLAAGLSKRFGNNPKWIAKVGPDGETFIEYTLAQALSAGFSKLVLVVSDKTKPLFDDILKDNYKGVPVEYSYQNFDPAKRDRPWGVIDALVCAKPHISGPLVVFGGDDILGKEPFQLLVNHLRSKTTSASVGHRLKNVIPENGTVNRGIFSATPDGKITSLKEYFKISKHTLSQQGLTEDSLCNMLIFGFIPEDLNLIEKALMKFKSEHQGERMAECIMSDEIGIMIENGDMKMDLYATSEKWYGLTNPEDEETVREALKNK